MKCEGTLSITYQGGEERNKWIKDELKEQALKLFPSANFIDGKPENNFKVQVDFEKLDAADRKKYLGTKAENPQKLCGCIPKTKAIKPIHNEISNNETEHFSGVIARPARPSTQSQFLGSSFWQVAWIFFLPFIIPFYSLFYFIERTFISPLSILTGVNITLVAGGFSHFIVIFFMPLAILLAPFLGQGKKGTFHQLSRMSQNVSKLSQILEQD